MGERSGYRCAVPIAIGILQVSPQKKNKHMKKILVIEDNLDVRENLAEILELSNYQVFTAENGKIGVKTATQELPDLIICDVMMPELDGFGVLKILDKNPKTNNIPFVFLTAKSESRDFRKGMNLGADDYITKPFDSVELLEAIEIRLKKSERIQQAFDGTPNGLSQFINVAKGQEELQKLSEEKETRRYKKKDLIYMEDDFPKRLYFIVSGKVKIFKTNELGKEYIIHIHTPGEFFGYHSLISEAEYTDSAAALEDCEISFVPKEDFYMLLYNNRDFSAKFIKMLSDNSMEKEEQLLSLAYSSIRKRVADALVKLYQRYESDGISILREDLASMVGTAKESVIRTLTEFKNEGLIDINNSVITIKEPAKLMVL